MSTALAASMNSLLERRHIEHQAEIRSLRAQGNISGEEIGRVEVELAASMALYQSMLRNQFNTDQVARQRAASVTSVRPETEANQKLEAEVLRAREVMN